MEKHFYDVIIIGAGASGLMAAWELVQTGKKIIIVEARDRMGGRIHTIQPPGFELPIDTGAEFVHGKLKLTQMILEKAGLSFYEVAGDIWQKQNGQLQEQKDFIEDYSSLNKKFKELNSDIPVAEFINKHLGEDKYEQLRLNLRNYVEGYYAADTINASTFALRDELNQSTSRQYRIEGGYSRLIDWLCQQCIHKGAEFMTSSPVEKINWQKDHVEVTVNDIHLNSKKLLVTVPVSVLQEEKITFSPALTQKIIAAQKLGYGPVIKSMLQFDEEFWSDKKRTQGKDLSEMSFIFSDATIPTWWTTQPNKSGMVTGWSGGPHAKKLMGFQRHEILKAALDSLGKIFDTEAAWLKEKLKAWHIADWPSDPFGCYGYSYHVVNSHSLQKMVRQPIDNTLFFAGEGLYEGVEIGTVEAALQTGQDAAFELIAGFRN